MHSIFKFIVLFSLFCTSQLFAVVLTDDFENNTTSGWVNTVGVTTLGAPLLTPSSQVLQLKSKEYGYKMFNLDVSLAGTSVTITFDLYGEGDWSNTTTDFVYVLTALDFNGTTGFQVETLSTNHKVVSYNTTVDPYGLVRLYIYPESNNTTYIDNVVVSALGTPTSVGYRPFTLRFKDNFYGKMYTIGNSVLVPPEKQKEKNLCDKYLRYDPTKTGDAYGPYFINAPNSNDTYKLCAYYADPNNDVFPTSMANLPAPQSATATIKWAGLYWQALVRSIDYPDNTLKTMQIQLKDSQMADYIDVNASVVDFDPNVWPGYTGYAAFAELTDVNLSSGDIYIGDIPVVEGNVSAIGTYGAWTLVVIYEDLAEDLRNFSIFDGWQQINAANPELDIIVSGFRTPKSDVNVSVDISVFAAEGDKNITKDTLEVKPSKNPTFTQLIDNFDSTITTSPIRDPFLTNNQGADIRFFPLGNDFNNTTYTIPPADIIQPEESSMVLRFSSKPTYGASGDGAIAQDKYFPSMVAFSAKLNLPKICYDYTATIGDFIPVNSSGRDINTSIFGGEPLKIQLLIQSQEADFIYEHAKAYITFTHDANTTLTYDSNYSEMSPPQSNTYYTYAQGFTEIESNASIGQLNIGSGVIGSVNNLGGQLLPNRITYAKIGHDVTFNDANQTNLITHFDLHYDAAIDYGSTLVDYSFTTEVAQGPASIDRCPASKTYDPIRLGFNIERSDCNSSNVNECYSLPTRIVDKNYTVDIVAYQGDINGGTSTTLAGEFNGTLELELINAGAFDNNSSAGYDTTCQTPSAIGTGRLVHFPPHSGGKITVSPVDLQLAPHLAVKNGAFRLWMLSVTDENGTAHGIVHHCQHKDNSDNCFTDIYNNDIVNTALNLDCNASCSNNNANCYQCLKRFYATPICSRDNFAIRPESFQIFVSDDKEKDPSVIPQSIKNNAQDTTGVNAMRLSAGYDYRIDINTTSYNGIGIRALGYYNDKFLYQRDIVNADPYANLIHSNASLAMVEFNDNASCYDQNHSTIALTFADGKLTGDNHFRYENVGKYQLWLSDSTWTEVDQSNYAYKPFPSITDCVQNSTSSSGALVGCTFTSVKDSLTKLNADINPYYFSMSGISVNTLPDTARNYTYFNDFSHPYYSDLVVHPIDNASVTYNGLLIAKGKDQRRVSNFTKSCAADDVTLKATITTTPSDANATTPLQQYLQYKELVAPATVATYATSGSLVTGIDQSIILSKNAFPDRLIDGDIKPGKAKIYLHTTFKKPKDIPSDPITASYTDINASSSSLWSNVDLINNHIPKGHQATNKTFTYYFAKVSPLQTFYDKVLDSSKITPLSIDIYCSDMVDCNGTYNLTTNAVNGKSYWYADTFYDATKDGTTDLSISTKFGTDASPSVTPNSNIAFIHNNAERQDINVSVSGNARPTTVDIQIEPVPWFAYNPLDLTNGYSHYLVKFIGNSAWSGVGPTGHVTGTTSNKNTNHRMNW